MKMVPPASSLPSTETLSYYKEPGTTCNLLPTSGCHRMTVTSKPSGSGKAIKNQVPKICAVCADKSTGMHFGAMTCEGCKGFFRRSIQKKGNFVCLFEGNCTINKVTRKHCQACRYQACMAVGMKSELVMTEQEVNEKRELIKRNREKRLQQHQQKMDEEEKKQQQQRKLSSSSISSSSSQLSPCSSMMPSPHQPPVRMTMEHKILIEVLLKGHQQSYDFDYKEFESFRGLNEILSPDSTKDGKFKHESLAWLVASLNPNQLQQRRGADDSDSDDSQAEIDVESTSAADQFTNRFGNAEIPPGLEAATIAVRAATSGSNEKSEPTLVSSPTGDVFMSLHGTTNNRQKLKPVKPSSGDNKASSSDVEAKKDSAATGESFLYLHGLLRSQGFSLDMIKDTKSILLLQHFCDIMSWGIRKVIEFCKGIPEFVSLALVDQIILLKGGCLEMLVLRSYFAFSSNGNKYMSEKFQYQPSDFLKAGASEEFVEAYNKLHLRMRKLKLQVEEICLLLALVLFSPDRIGLNDRDKVEKMQTQVCKALETFEYTNKPPGKARLNYTEVLLILPVLRTINKLFSKNIESLQADYESDMNPLIFEVNAEVASSSRAATSTPSAADNSSSSSSTAAESAASSKPTDLSLRRPNNN